MNYQSKERNKQFPLREVRIRLTKGDAVYADEPIHTTEGALRVMRKELSSYDREVICIVNLNAKMQPLNFNIVGVGDLSTCLGYIPNILKSCILSNAFGFLMLHNHPTGIPTPSEADIELTKRVVMAGQILGIPCLDHVIVGAYQGDYFSMKENNLVDFNMDLIEAMKGAKNMAAEQREMMDSPFGPIDPMEMEAALQGTENDRTYGNVEEISIKFSKKLCTFFKSRKDVELAAIKIPDDRYDSWPQFVLPANHVHENQFGKGYWAKIPADGRTTLSFSKKIEGADGPIYQKMTFSVSNQELKNMVEAYKRDDPQKSEHPPVESQQKTRAYAR